MEKPPETNGVSNGVKPTITAETNLDPYQELAFAKKQYEKAIENVIVYEVDKRIKAEMEKLLNETKPENWAEMIKKRFEGGTLNA